MRHILGACGTLVVLFGAACSAATPTVDPAQIQASAVAAASTMVAMTQEAMPTPTEVPPTEVPSPTPLPVPTVVELPTLSFEAPTAAPTQSSGDDCNHLLDLNETGNARAKLLINNNTKGPVTLTIGLGSKNAFGQCGYLSWSNIPRNSSITVSVPQTGAGPCYWAYAWVNDPKNNRTLSPGQLYCMNNPDKWVMDIGYDTIKLTPP
jgi:hypothetical protein